MKHERGGARAHCRTGQDREHADGERHLNGVASIRFYERHFDVPSVPGVPSGPRLAGT